MRVSEARSMPEDVRRSDRSDADRDENTIHCDRCPRRGRKWLGTLWLCWTCRGSAIAALMAEARLVPKERP
jgi:hypothetical protein